MPLEVWAGFGIGILVLAAKFCGLYTSHAYSEFFAFHKFFALHMGHRTPQLGTRTYYIKSTHSARSSHSIKSSYSVIFRFFRFFFFRFFFLGGGAKIAWNHVFWNMGKVAVFRETSVVAHTIAFQAILAKKEKKGKKKLSKVKCDNFLVYDGKNWCLIHGEGRRGPRILFYFRIPEN